VAKQAAAAKAAEHYGQLADQNTSYAYDPYGWVMYAFPWGSGELEGETGPDDWQRDFLVNLGNRVTDNARPDGGVIREAIASGHGPGKSSLVAWILLWCLSTFPNSKGVVTANTEGQLKTKTWAELSKWHRLCITKDLFELAATAIYWKGREFEKTFRIDMAPWSLENTEAFQGLHNKKQRLIVIFDESSAIADEIWNVTEGALTDVGTEIIWCVFGNPTRNTGRFRECFDGGKFAHRWNHKQIDTRTCKFSNKVQIKEWQDDYGEDSDFFKVRVRGLFPSASDRQFISTRDVDAAYGKILRPEQYNFAPKILTLDPAWTGKNELVFGLRQGLFFKILRTMPKNDNDVEVAQILANEENNQGADAVFIDKGWGTGIWSCGQTWKKQWELVDFGSGSPDQGCRNMRAYLWRCMRDWLKIGGAIEQDLKLRAAIMAPETVPGKGDGKIQIQSKEELDVDVGRADALAISFFREVTEKKSRDRLTVGSVQTHTDNSSPSYIGLGRGIQEQTERQTFREVSWRQ
jgi:hypothetical protein